MLTKVRSHRSDLLPVHDHLSYMCSTLWLIADVCLCSNIRTTQTTWDFFPYVWRQAHHWFWWKILFENQCSSLPSCNWSSLSFLLAKENEICKAVGCVAILWWTLYTGFKLFCLGYGEMEFIWQPQETGPHLIACNEIHPPETLPCAGSICWYPFKLFIDFHGTVTSVSKLTLVTLLKGTGSLEQL